jgi:hypothetical protein
MIALKFSCVFLFILQQKHTCTKGGLPVVRVLTYIFFFSTELHRLFMGEIELDGAVVSPATRHEFDSAVALRGLFGRR